MTFGEISQQLANVANGPCADDPQLKVLTFQAIKLLFDSGYWVGSFGTLRVQTFDGDFSLPYGYERVVEVSQCMSDGSFNQAWCQIQDDSAFLEPEQWQDGEMISLSDGPLQNPLLSASILSVRPDNPLDTGIELTVTGILPNGNVASLNSGECTETIGIFADTYNDGRQTYADGFQGVLSITKPKTKGPVRIYAYQGAQRYLVTIAQPFETEVLRRRYRFPEVTIPQIPVSSITYETDHVLIDTGLPEVQACAGQSVYITGFCPGYINGLRTITSIDGGIIRVDGSFSGVVDTITEIIGSVTQVACLNLTALKRPVPIVSDSQDVIFRNLLAIQLALRAVSMPFGNGIEEYQKCIVQAQALLKDEVTRYGQDPIRSEARIASLRYDLDRFPFGTLGYVRARLMLDLPGGMKIGKRIITRLINEAQERIIANGKTGNSVRQKQYIVDVNSAIVLERDENSLLTASICGQPIDIEDEYYASSKPVGNNGAWGIGWGVRTGIAGPFGINGSCKWRAIDYGMQDIYDGNRAYWVVPCSIGKCVNATVKLKYIPIEEPQQPLVITNYVALKTMCEAIIARDAKDMNTYNSLEGKAFSILDKDKGQKRGGAKALPRFNTTFKDQRALGMR